MNTTYKSVPTSFGPETRFEVRPAPPAPFRAFQETAFEKLRDELLSERLEQTASPPLNSHIRRAANEAAALAWITPYPLLVFPALFEEKAEIELTRAEKQLQVHALTRELLAV